MSVRASTWAWEQGRLGAAKRGELLTLLRVADHADNDGVCWPGQRSLADYTAQGESTVRDQLRRLEERGLLTRERRRPEEGQRRATDRILLPLDSGGRGEGSTAGSPPDLPPADGQGTNKGTVKNHHKETVERIFDFWVGKLGKTDHRLTDTRRKRVIARLEEDFTPREICEAIDGITRSPHNMGENERRQMYDDLELICRSPENVERFRDLHRQAKRRGAKAVDVNARRKQIRREQGLD